MSKIKELWVDIQEFLAKDSPLPMTYLNFVLKHPERYKGQ